jgi:glycosyltransferase involved in cell wall biosynthesis
MTAPPKHLFLADHLLRDAIGHHLGYNLAIADAAARAGVTPHLVTHRAFDPLLAEGVACHRIFRTDFRAEPPAWIARNHRLLGALETWCDGRFGGDLARLPAVAGTDAVFAQMLAPRHFHHWLRWIAATPSPPVLFLHLGYRPERFTRDKAGIALDALPGRIRKRVVLATDSEKLVGAFEKNLSSKVFHLPHILSYPIPGPDTRQPARPFRIYAPGNARREKGFAELVAAVRQIRKSGQDGDFRFFLPGHHPDPASREIIRRGLPLGDAIEWITHPLDDDDYVKHLVGADVVVLPYHLDLYAMRTSGIFCEARVAGKPVIVSRGSWAGDRVHREGGGWLVHDRDAASLAAAILSVPSEITAKSAEARNLSPRAGAEFHRDHFMAGLLEIYSSAAHGGS